MFYVWPCVAHRQRDQPTLPSDYEVAHSRRGHACLIRVQRAHDESLHCSCMPRQIEAQAIAASTALPTPISVRLTRRSDQGSPICRICEPVMVPSMKDST